MPAAFFSPALFDFLKELQRHNERAWFLSNKQRYESAIKEPALAFVAAVGAELKKLNRHYDGDPRPVGGSLMRIYRDTRFSKDKTPYKTNVGMHFGYVGAEMRFSAPGFYIHLAPGDCFLAGGMWHPEADALMRIRRAMVDRPQRWKAVKAAKLPLGGDSLQRAPAGFDPAHPFVEDLRRKDFITSWALTEAQVCAPRVLTEVTRRARRMLPLMKFLTEAMGLPW